MSDDRRQSKRRAMLVEVRYEGGGVRAQTRISDLSATGIYVDVMSPLPEGETLKLDFKLPDDYEVQAEGVVVRSEPRIGMAVRFTQIKPEDQQRIAEIILQGD